MTPLVIFSLGSGGLVCSCHAQEPDSHQIFQHLQAMPDGVDSARDGVGPRDWQLSDAVAESFCEVEDFRVEREAVDAGGSE